jgi:hypothetical protein
MCSGRWHNKSREGSERRINCSSHQNALGGKTVKLIESNYKKPISSKPKTPLGKKLLRFRERIVASGEALLTWEDIEREIIVRRGEKD